MSKTVKKTKPSLRTKTIAKAKPKSEKQTIPSLKQSQIDTPSTSTKRNDSIVIKKNYALISVVILIGLGLVGAYMLNRWLVVAQVNGKSISRLDYIREMEAQVGEQTLNQLVTQELIYQQAQVEGVTVPVEEVDAEIQAVRENLQQQGQDLDQLLALQGMSEAQLREQIELQKLVAKLANTQEEVSEEELQAYIEENRDFFPEEMTEEELADYSRERYLADANQTKIQDYLQQLREQASIQYSEGF